MRLDAISRQELAREDRLRQRVLHLLLDRALERPRIVHRVVPCLTQPVERGIVEHELEIAIEQSALEIRQLNVDDGTDLRLFVIPAVRTFVFLERHIDPVREAHGNIVPHARAATITPAIMSAVPAA